MLAAHDKRLNDKYNTIVSVSVRYKSWTRAVLHKRNKLL